VFFLGRRLKKLKQKSYTIFYNSMKFGFTGGTCIIQDFQEPGQLQLFIVSKL